MRDYKFDSGFSNRPRKRGRRLLLSLFVLTLAGVGAAWLYGQLAAGDSEPVVAGPSEVESPATPSAETSEPARPEVLSAPLALPPKSSSNSNAANLNPNATVAAKPRVEAAQPASMLLQAAPEQSAQPPVDSTKTAQQLADESVAEEPTLTWETHKIARGESLARIFKASNLSASLLHRIVHSSKLAADLANIRPGQTLRFQRDAEGELQQLVLVKSPIESLHIRAIDEGFDSELESKAVDTHIATATGTIESSLFVDGQKAGLDDGQIMELAALFGWDVDFALEIRAGDQFRVIYEEDYLDGKKYRNGPILAAEFVNQGTTHTAFRFEDGKGNLGYYDAEGRSKRRAFIRTPIKFARISSGFSLRRWHPLLKRWRSHKGVDYAAPKGTPIKVTGAGRVVFRGRQHGYGNVVIVQHGGKYQTVYAHMSKFVKKVRKGSRVKQGQVIGYVGMTGLATGPHLHYEFRVNGVHRNPLTVKLPKSKPLPGSEMAAFKRATAPLVAQLAEIRQDTMVASASDR